VEKKQAILMIKSIIIWDMRFIFLFCLSLYFFNDSLRADEFCLRELFAQAEPGSYFVTEQNKNYTFLHIFQKNDSFIILEEVSIPLSRFPKKTTWKEWFEKGAQGHTAWLMTQINLKTGKCEEAFSFIHQGWLDLSHADHFLATLLNLKFAAVPEPERRRIGLPPGYHKTDKRPLWNPPLIVEGKIIPHVAFSAWKTRWPNDGSELSRKIIEIYLPSFEDTPSRCPAYFPYWLEVEGKMGSAKVRIVDSGMGAKSPKSTFPLRPPQILGSAVFTEEGVIINLKSPPYYQDFTLIAEEKNGFFGKSFLLPSETQLDDGTARICVPQNILFNYMNKGEIYTFTISPKDHPFVLLETQQIRY
jgi:hypothetical protein